MQEAESSQQKLHSSVEQLLQNDIGLTARMRHLEQEVSGASRHEDRISNTISSKVSNSQENHLPPSIDTDPIGFAFEEDLNSSRVYQNSTLHHRHSETSITTSALFSTALSVFSHLSLAQVSNISFYVLPVYARDLYNDRWYTFGDTRVETTSIGRSRWPTGQASSSQNTIRQSQGHNDSNSKDTEWPLKQGGEPLSATKSLQTSRLSQRISSSLPRSIAIWRKRRITAPRNQVFPEEAYLYDPPISQSVKLSTKTGDNVDDDEEVDLTVDASLVWRNLGAYRAVDTTSFSPPTNDGAQETT